MKSVKKVLVYFPVVLVSLQVLANLYALIDRESYNAIGFYLNTFIGTNILFSFFLLAFTFSFNFCRISRFSAIAECMFGLNYLIVQQDNLYNILFQVIVGVIFLILTYLHFINKFPLCKLSLIHKLFASLLASLFTNGSCAKGIDNYQKNIESTVKQAHYAKRQYRVVD